MILLFLFTRQKGNAYVNTHASLTHVFECLYKNTVLRPWCMKGSGAEWD